MSQEKTQKLTKEDIGAYCWVKSISPLKIIDAMNFKPFMIMGIDNEKISVRRLADEDIFKVNEDDIILLKAEKGLDILDEITKADKS
jgi:hypothetical protein